MKGATITNMLAETVKNKIQGKEEKVEQKKFEMPEYITDGNNSYVQRFIRRWDLNINLMYDVIIIDSNKKVTTYFSGVWRSSISIKLITSK